MMFYYTTELSNKKLQAARSFHNVRNNYFRSLILYALNFTRNFCKNLKINFVEEINCRAKYRANKLCLYEENKSLLKPSINIAIQNEKKLLNSSERRNCFQFVLEHSSTWNMK